MARRWLNALVLALTLNHLSLQLFGTIGFLGVYRVQRSTVRVRAADPMAYLSAASAGASLADYLTKLAKYFQETINRVPRLEQDGDVSEHAQTLLEKFVGKETPNNLLADRPPIIPEAPVVPPQTVNDTEFEGLMKAVLKDEKTSGLSAVHAEAGVGKTVATAMAIRNFSSKSSIVAVLQGSFYKNLKDFFRLSDVEDVVGVALELFVLLKDRGIRLEIIFDNTFDTGVGNDRSLLMGLTRHAFSYGHHLIVITQSEEAASEAGNLNGARTRLWRQQDAHAYRWSITQASEYLATISTLVSNVNEMQVEEVLNMTQIPDEFGGWKPVDVDEFLRTGRRPRAPQQGQGGRSTANPAVWVRQLQKDGSGCFEFVGNAFKITGAVADIDDLKKAIEKEMKLSIAAPLIEIFSQQDGWKKEDEEASVERGVSKSDCYGYLIP